MSSYVVSAVGEDGSLKSSKGGSTAQGVITGLRAARGL